MKLSAIGMARYWIGCEIAGQHGKTSPDEVEGLRADLAAGKYDDHPSADKHLSEAIAWVERAGGNAHGAKTYLTVMGKI